MRRSTSSRCWVSGRSRPRDIQRPFCLDERTATKASTLLPRKAFSEQLALAKQSAASHSSLGVLLDNQEISPESVPHFDESYRINKVRLGARVGMGFDQANRAARVGDERGS